MRLLEMALAVLLVLALVGAALGAMRPGRRRRATGATLLVALTLVAGACRDDGDDNGGDSATDAADDTAADDPVAAAEERFDEAEALVADAQEAYVAAGDQFCADAEGYVEALDRYGKLFTTDAATVGDVRAGGDDLVEPRDAVAGSADAVSEAQASLADAQAELVAAQAELDAAIATASSLPTSTTEPPTPTTTTIVPEATIDRVEQAEDDLERAATGITDRTPLTEATAEYNSAALALEVAWLQLLDAAGCLGEEQAEAVAQLTAFTTGLQTSLQQLGYYEGAVDGIYGPQTVDAVKRFQADQGLSETGYVDQATDQALSQALADQGAQEAEALKLHTATVQTVLTLAGFWMGPIDGEWTDELTAALMAFQTELGVPPTGEVDTATMAAFEDAVAAIRILVSTSTTVAPPTTATPPTAAPPPAPPAPPDSVPPPGSAPSGSAGA